MTSCSFAYGPSAPTPGPLFSQPHRSTLLDQQKTTQARQLLSCTKCRERKVKCDRTKPCSACCARGHPKECEFIVGEGNDYTPIQQSYEIRKLRAENQKLKEKIQQVRLAGSGNDYNSDEDNLSYQKGQRGPSRMAASRQRRFGMGERIDNLYFGSPGLANIVSDFSNLQVGSHSLTHTVPRGRDMYLASDGPLAHPFPMMQGGNGAGDLARALLDSHEFVFGYLQIFQRWAQPCYFPYIPDEMTKREVSRFLDDAVGNSEKHPDFLALLFAVLAVGMQISVHEKHNGWTIGAVEDIRRTSDVYLAAAMQALRLASFLNTPTMLGTQALIMIGPYLANSGRFLDAWTLFGITIRMAHSIGLHRDPKLLDPVPSLRESTTRQTLWWWMLHMDQEYSVTLGRPLGISGFGDCPPSEPLSTSTTTLRLGEFVHRFTIVARQLLGSGRMMEICMIDEFTDRLVGLWDTMPESLQFNESWLRATTQLPDWPLDVTSAMMFCKMQSFLILLNRQRVERTQPRSAQDQPPISLLASRKGPCTGTSEPHAYHASPIRGRTLVVHSSVQILQAFMFFHHRNPAMLICWALGQQAFNACMILILDAWETGDAENELLVAEAAVVFYELRRNGVHRLADLATSRVGDGLTMLRNRRQQHEQQVAAMTRQQQIPVLQIDTATLPGFSFDSVMGNTGMFLVDDLGVQCYSTVPLCESMDHPMGCTGSAPSSNASSRAATPNMASPVVPVSQATVLPCPMMPSPLSMTSPASDASCAATPIALNPKVPLQRQQQRSPYIQEPAVSQMRSADGQHGSGVAALSGSRGALRRDNHFLSHNNLRPERTPRSQQRRDQSGTCCGSERLFSSVRKPR